MSDFTASNGATVELTPEGALTITPRQDLPLFAALADRGWEIAALREFFLHERDEQLGRWRWPENPDYVVYPAEPGFDFDAFVVDERRGASAEHRRTEGDWPPRANTNTMRDVARAYFDAHPEPQPWHAAKEGELWLLRPGDALNELPYVAVDDTDGETSVGPRFFRVPSPKPFAPGRFPSEFVEGRRIWPEPEATS